MYDGSGAPALLGEEIKNYQPLKLVKNKTPEEQWADLFKRVYLMDDDSHAAKLLRAVAGGNRIWQEKGDTSLITKEMWLKMGHMAVDSTENETTQYVRGAGHASAWSQIENREERLPAAL